MYAIELRLRTNSCTNDVPYLYAFLICFMYKPLLSTVDTQSRRFTNKYYLITITLICELHYSKLKISINCIHRSEQFLFFFVKRWNILT